MSESIILAPTADPLVFVAPDGSRLSPPPGWQCLPPGDAGLTRRVKAKGASWSVIEKRGRKAFSKGLWAPQEHIAAAQAELAAERATDSYAKRRQSDLARRERQQVTYVESFAQQVLAFLRFAPPYAELAQALAARVTELSTPVGSGTVARTERIPIERRAEAAVIAWLRHQTTTYDQLAIPRVKGLRRQVRRELAEAGRVVLDRHRRAEPHAVVGCPLCTALRNIAGPVRLPAPE
jgi:hypothetical protein